jgi:hypothetical protein
LLTDRLLILAAILTAIALAVCLVLVLLGFIG